MPSMEIKAGSSGEDVLAIKRKLVELGFLVSLPDRNDPEYDNFNEEIKKAVISFQTGEWLIENGVVDITTWNALMGRETYLPFFHPVNLCAQPDENSCWKACLRMISGMSLLQAEEETPRHLFDERGLYNFSQPSGMTMTEASIEFAGAHGLRFMVFSQKPLHTDIYRLVAEGPVMIETEVGRSRRLREGFNSHWVVIADIRGDNDPSGQGAVVRIYDPEPVNQGSVYSEIYGKWIAGGDIHRAFW